MQDLKRREGCLDNSSRPGHGSCIYARYRDRPSGLWARDGHGIKGFNHDVLPSGCMDGNKQSRMRLQHHMNSGRMSGGLACGPGCRGLQDGPEDSRTSGRAPVGCFLWCTVGCAKERSHGTKRRDGIFSVLKMFLTIQHNYQ